MTWKYSSAAEHVVIELNKAGYEAYFVGGCVRDMLMSQHETQQTYAGVKLSDIDIATNALPQEVKTVFAGVKVIETGIEHGTVTVLMAEPVEVTTYRVEGAYSDGRRPDSVDFTMSLGRDLSRRDFTMNAIAMDMDGNIKDPFDGRGDIEKKMIRAVGDADRRFGEDALRIMRALRFAAVLDFDIEEETEAALFRNSSRLANISPERILAELKRLVTGKAAGRVIRKYVDVLGAVIPELSAMKGFQQHNAYHKYDVLEHCIRAMEAVKTTDDNRLHMKLAALLHDVGKPLVYSSDDKGRGHFYGHAAKSRELTDVIMKRLRADNALTGRVGILVKYHDLIFQRDEGLLKKWMNRFSPEVLFEILEIKRADNLATGNMSRELMEKFHDIESMMKAILAQEQCFSLAQLAVTGHDIMRLGVPCGPQVGDILNRLLEAVIEGKTVNEHQQLMKLAEIYKED